MNIVLIEPEIHWNTGNIGRTCVATGARLHLVGKLGFSLDDKQIRRSGLDYWSKLDLTLHADFEAFLKTTGGAALHFLSTKGRKSLWDAELEPGSYLIFGNEGSGLPAPIHERFGDRMLKIPMTGDVRSLNLSTAAAVVLFEALRQTHGSASPAL
jgi:tRNA (cytidine/uridine-2'-O-)-methyltransferase